MTSSKCLFPLRLITHRESLFPKVRTARSARHGGVRFNHSGNKSYVLRSTFENDLNRSRDATTMFTNTKSVLSVAIMLGTASVALAAPRYPTAPQAGPSTRHKAPTSTYGSDSLAPAPGQITRMSAEYFNPNPATFKAFTFCASVPLGPSISKRELQGEFRIPRFQCDAKCIGTNYFLNRRCPDAGLRPQN